MADIRIETFDVNVGATGQTYTLAQDVGNVNNAFIRNNTGTRKMSAGPTGSTGNTAPNVGGVGIELTGTNEITFHRDSATEVKCVGEVWRYIGPPGGEHEFIVRGRFAIALTGTSASQAVSGIVTEGDCVPFITGILCNTTSTSDWNDATVAAHMDGSGNVVVSRNNSGVACTVYVTVVEFTGSAWSVGHAVSNNHDTSSETVTMNTHPSGAGGSTFDVTDWTTAFIEGLMGGDSGETGLADTLGVWYPAAGTTQIIFSVTDADSGARNDATAYAHIIQNDSLVVYREVNTNVAEGNGSYGTVAWPTGAPTDQETRHLALEWYVSTSGTGTAHMRGSLGARVTGSYLYDQGDVVDSSEYDSTMDVTLEFVISFTASPDGVIFDAGGTGTGTYIGFDSGNLIVRAGNGSSATPSNDTAFLEITPAMYDFASRSGRLTVTITGSDTITVTFDEGDNGSDDYTNSNTATSPFADWSGGDLGGVGTSNGNVAGSHNTLDFNGTISFAKLDQGVQAIRHWVHRNGNNVLARYGLIDVTALEASGTATNAERGAEATGQESASGERGAELEGVTSDLATADRAAELGGSVDTDAERGAEAAGVDTGTAERGAELTGAARATTWFDAQWTKRASITISADQVDDVLSGFPVYVDLSDMPSGFWSAVKSDGGDIVVADLDGNRVAVHVVAIDTVAETGRIYFKADLDANPDNLFFIYYGNGSASQPAVGATYGRNEVWNGYEAVWLLEESGAGTTGEFIDATGNGHDGTGGDGVLANTPTRVSDSVTGYAQDFDGTDLIKLGDIAAIEQAATMSISAIVTMDDNTGEESFFSFGDAWTDYVIFGHNNGGGLWWHVENRSNTGSAATEGEIRTAPLDITAGQAVHVLATYDGNQPEIIGYVDGTQRGQSTDVPTLTPPATGTHVIGKIGHDPSRHLYGTIYYIRITTNVLPAAWSKAEHANFLDRANFYTIGSEETNGTTVSAERGAELRGAPSWQIQRQDNGGAWFDIEAEIAIDEQSNEYTYLDPGPLTNGVTYCYRVRNLHPTPSGWSNVDCFTYTAGTGANGERGAEIRGVAQALAERGAEVGGTDTADSERGAEVSGTDTASAERDAELTGEATDQAERGAEATGQDGAGAERGAEVSGQDSDQAERGAEIVGEDTAEGERGAELKGADEAQDERGAEIGGELDADAERGAETAGEATTGAERGAEVLGDGGTAATRDAELRGVNTDQAERSAELGGEILDTADRGAELSGVAIESSERGAEVTGFLTDADERGAELVGVARDLAERSAELSGTATDQAERDAELQGEDTAEAERGAEVTGTLTALAQRAAELIGQAIAVAQRAAEIIGELQDAGERSGELTGQDTDATEREAEVGGQASAGGERGAEVVSILTADGERGAELSGGLRTSKPQRNVLGTKRQRHVLRHCEQMSTLTSTRGGRDVLSSKQEKTRLPSRKKDHTIL